MNCIACAHPSVPLFKAIVLFRYNVNYFHCLNCGQLQTDEPYWLDEAYQTAIASLDIGLLGRCIRDSKRVFELVTRHLDTKGRMLDYGGGYGTLVRLLRDKGLDFYRQDIYCQNIFAINHDLSDLPTDSRNFELVTCFEVLEHTYDPFRLLKTLSCFAPHVLISTLIVPEHEISSPNDWWYIAPETGQHIAFYTHRSLKILADQLNLNFYSNGQDLHLFTIRLFSENPLLRRNTIFDKITGKLLPYCLSKKKLPSLIAGDIETARQKAFDKSE
ncbi:class I SAM-dependent methyltransferase [Mucilaginibacter aquaedulcis]|uniref:class I SAM-dependent methyltransferase n=1 Tax=Mucilaginibacter aquaedulcis TaxID=1187081 RepID=UPI0025B56983|nr:class I SAM-dependent methyltransferase [Mucilaginibacter aquaedulcis]MDN3548728.1 class I SAM-dependent methyltransferase [Mucilaginibacter aquaedulcis]